LPEEEAYQFYAPVLTADDFMRDPYIPGKFFQYGLELKGNVPQYTNLINDGFTFDIVTHNRDVSLSSRLRTAQQGNIDAASWHNRKGEIVSFDFDVPDTGDYKGVIFAKFQNQDRLQDRVALRTFEEVWVPGAEKLFGEEKITEDELDYFRKSYYKIADNNYYYFLEDQFDRPRNNAVTKIHDLLELDAGWMETVLEFAIKAAPAYQGFGRGILKYPYTLPHYNDVPNTQLISPTAGVLKAGSQERFTVFTRDFTHIAIRINGEFIQLEKNSDGDFESAFTIPAGLDTLDLFGSTNGNQYVGLIRYTVTP
jgi:hypothetical protein